jgi:hypothetical protein
MGARVRRREFFALVGGGGARGAAQGLGPTGRSYRVDWINVSHGFAELTP